MKTTLKFAIAVTLFVSALTAAIVASPNMLFTVNNNTSFVIGTVTIYNTNGIPTTIDVSGPGTFSVNVPGGVAAAVINNQSIPKNRKGVNITLSSGFVVQVTMTGNQIIVTDQTIINGDKKPHGH